MFADVIKIEQTDEILGMVLNFLWGTPKAHEPNLNRLFQASDSINEIPEYYAFCSAPRSVAMQLETHKKKHGCYLWMESARPDLALKGRGLKTEYSREQEVKFVFKFTARGMKEISHMRMCHKAEEKTREFMNILKNDLLDKEPALAAVMEPLCAYRNGKCTEIGSCGYNKSLGI